MLNCLLNLITRGVKVIDFITLLSDLEASAFHSKLCESTRPIKVAVVMMHCFNFVKNCLLVTSSGGNIVYYVTAIVSVDSYKITRVKT